MSTVKQIEAAAPMMQMMAEMQKGPAAGGAARSRESRGRSASCNTNTHN